MTVKLDVLVDADVLGPPPHRRRDLRSNLLARAAGAPPAHGLRVAATTRHPELVPDGIEAIAPPGPIAGRRLGRPAASHWRAARARLLHTQYVVPPDAALPGRW